MAHHGGHGGGGHGAHHSGHGGHHLMGMAVLASIPGYRLLLFVFVLMVLTGIG